MGSVLLFDAARMQAIEDGTVVSGLVDVSGNLILKRRDNSEINAGKVEGHEGVDGLTAYQVALSDGFVGDKTAWLASLKGEDGEQGAAATLACGMYIDWPTVAPLPSYLLKRDGAAVSRTTYSTLFGLIGTTFGVGDGSTTFNLPNSTKDGFVSLKLSAAQNVPAGGANAPINWDSEVSDNDDLHSILTNPSRITVDRTGRWELIAQTSLVTTSSWNSGDITVNGVVVPNTLKTVPSISSVSYPGQIFSIFLDLVVGDYVQIRGSSSAITALYTSGCFFQMRYLGPTQEAKTTPTIVATDQGLGVTVINGGAGGLALGLFVPMGGDSSAPIPANCLELNGQSVLAATYSGLAAMYPSWVSGANLVLPDMRGRTMVGYKSGDDFFGTLGGTPGSKYLQAHTHKAGGGNNFVRAGAGTSANVTIGGGGYSVDSDTQSTGAGASQNVQPSYVGRWLVVASDSAGEFSPTVQAALVGRVSNLEIDLALPDPIYAPNSSTSTISATAGVWENITGSTLASFGNLTRPLWIAVHINAIVSTTAGAYAMIGAALSGAVAMSADYDVPGGSQVFNHAPFHIGADSHITDVRIIKLPIGTTNFRMQQRRSGGTGQVNYSHMDLVPIKWG